MAIKIAALFMRRMRNVISSTTKSHAWESMDVFMGSYPSMSMGIHGVRIPISSRDFSASRWISIIWPGISESHAMGHRRTTKWLRRAKTDAEKKQQTRQRLFAKRSHKLDIGVLGDFLSAPVSDSVALRAKKDRTGANTFLHT